MAKKESAAHYRRLHRELAEAMGYDPDKLSAVQEMRLDNAVALRLVSDSLRAALMRGEEVDHKELLAVTEGLQKLLPREPERDPAVPALYRKDPYKAMEDILDRWLAVDEQERSERGLSPRIHDEAALQRRVDDLEAELVRLRGAQPHALPSPAPEADETDAIDVPTSAITPPGEQTDSDRNLYRGGPRPPPGYDPIINGLWRPPEPDVPEPDVEVTNAGPPLTLPATFNDPEPWRNFVRPDGSISPHPIGGIRRDWSR